MMKALPRYCVILRIGETAWVISRHRTERAAWRAMGEISGMAGATPLPCSPWVEIRDASRIMADGSLYCVTATGCIPGLQPRIA